jgi:hypothetical protein
MIPANPWKTCAAPPISCFTSRRGARSTIIVPMNSCGPPSNANSRFWGEALNRLQKSEPALANQIPERRQIISFRNVLIHGYDTIDEAVVWKIVQQDLPTLRQHVESLLAELESGVRSQVADS